MASEGTGLSNGSDRPSGKNNGLQVHNNTRNRSPNILTHFGGGVANRESTTGASRKQDGHTIGESTRFDEPYGGSTSSSSPPPPKSNAMAMIDLQEIPCTNLGLGSMVDVAFELLDNQNGVIRSISFFPSSEQLLVGVELDNAVRDTPLDITDGVYRGQRLFKCAAGRGVFVNAAQVTADSRYVDDMPGYSMTDMTDTDEAMRRIQFGNVDCPSVEGIHEPMNLMTYADLQGICGMFKGIQGHLNSCYLDATLFGMFAFTRVFDSVLYREKQDNDLERYDEVQACLRDEIVNPLRTKTFVRADRVMKLRQMLGEICSVKGMMDEEKDPEEFLNLLMVTVLQEEPPLQLNTGQASFCYQLFVTKDDSFTVPTVQQLFDQSFNEGNTKLRMVPKCLMVQMPRFGKDFKMYPRVMPSLVLDVTDAIENSPRQCFVCGSVAQLECKDCFNRLLDTTSFCMNCYDTKHQHDRYRSHQPPTKLMVPGEYRSGGSPPRIYMDLFAVVCIETSHYVSFVKTGSGENAPWCFFDSMADRRGGQGGHNVPELKSVADLPFWINENDSTMELNDCRKLPMLSKRLLCDAYLCMYQSREVMMYK